jgi:hypothetical protein
MNFLDAYLKDYALIVNHLINNSDNYKKNELVIKDDVIYIKKDTLIKMFEKNKFEEKPRQKLKSWARLKWIQTEQKQYEKKIYNSVEKKQIRMIVIDINVFNIITELTNKDVK